MPHKFKAPEFVKYDSTGDPCAHLRMFYRNMAPDPNLHLSSQDTLFCFIICLFAPVWFFDSLSLSMLSFQLFLCLSASLFPLSFHVHAWSMDTWSKGATSQAQAKRARMQARRRKPTKGNVQQIRRPSLLEWLHLSLSIIASSLEQCICDANLNRHALRPNKQYQNMMRTSIDTL